jgi:hypothetical protein
MLPTFSKAQKILDEAWMKQVFDWKNKTFPLLHALHGQPKKLNFRKKCGDQLFDLQLAQHFQRFMHLLKKP